MSMLITSSRIRSLISDARTEKDIEVLLRTHKIRFNYATDTGTLSFRIPTKTGTLRIYRTCSRSCPFQVQTVGPVPFVPVLHNDY